MKSRASAFEGRYHWQHGKMSCEMFCLIPTCIEAFEETQPSRVKSKQQVYQLSVPSGGELISRHKSLLCLSCVQLSYFNGVSSIFYSLKKRKNLFRSKASVDNALVLCPPTMRIEHNAIYVALGLKQRYHAIVQKVDYGKDLLKVCRPPASQVLCKYPPCGSFLLTNSSTSGLLLRSFNQKSCPNR